MDKDKKALAEYRLDVAKDCLFSAQLEFDAEKYKASANRSYYAIFHAVRTVLALDGVDYKKHSAVFAHFRQNYIKPNIFDRKYSDIIKRAFSIRTDADYEDFYVVSKEEVEAQIEEATDFVNAVEVYIRVH